MLDAAEASPFVPAVPAEFVGRARLLRNRVAAADAAYHATLQDLLMPAMARLKRMPGRPLRQPMLTDIVRRWSTANDEWRIDLSTQISKGSVLISETRLLAGQMLSSRWTEAEPDVAAKRVELTLGPDGGARLTSTCLACWNLHSLARHAQRRHPASDDVQDLLGDMALVVDAAVAKPLVPGANYTISTTLDGSGGWRGRAVAVEGPSGSDVVLSIRTFY